MGACFARILFIAPFVSFILLIIFRNIQKPSSNTLIQREILIANFSTCYGHFKILNHSMNNTSKCQSTCKTN